MFQNSIKKNLKTSVNTFFLQNITFKAGHVNKLNQNAL